MECCCIMLVSLPILVTLLLLIYYVKSKRNFKHWEKRGVKFIEPTFILGNFSFPPKKNMAEKIIEWYQHFPEERYHGLFALSNPALLIKDPELIKEICVKEFDSFANHRFFIPAGLDPIWDKNLLILKDNKWKEMRSILSPSFTGSKMKIMFTLMEDVAVQVVEYLNGLTENNEETIEVILKDFCTRYTNDVIASTAFGLKVDSFRDKNNEFYKIGQELSDFGGFKGLKIMLSWLNPAVAKFFGMRVIPQYAEDYLTDLIKNTVETRKAQNIYRPDMINILMEEMDKERPDRPPITMDDILAQSLIFFLAGFESSATTIAFMFYELAVNPDCQNKLRNEINKIKEINYESVKNLKYLDAVVSETLRKWPVGIATEREVGKPFTIQPVKPGEKALELKPGDLVQLPMIALQRDPQYFEDPSKFDPERFNEENKSKIVPYSYFPFGVGPRACLGSRFALLETKILAVHLLKNFEFVPVKKTKIPMVLDKWGMQLTPKDGIFAGIKKINP